MQQRVTHTFHQIAKALLALVRVRPFRSYPSFGKSPVPLLLTAVFFAAVTTVISLPASANAAKTFNAQTTLRDRTDAYEYVQALNICYKDSVATHANIVMRESNGSKVKGGHLFYTPFGGQPSGAVDTFNPDLKKSISDVGDDNQFNCNNADWSTAPLSFFGLSGVDFVCQLGYTRQNSQQNCKEAGGDFDTKNSQSFNVTSTIKKLTGFDANNPGDEVKYQAWRDILDNGCIGGSISKSAYDKTDSKSRYAIQQADGSYKYYAAKSNKDQEPVAPDGSHKSDAGEPGGGTTCQAAQDGINKYYQAWANYVQNHANDQTAQGTGTSNTGDDSGGNSDTTSCAIDGVGWIVCPVMNFLGGIADASFGLISNNFLKVDPKLTTDPGTVQAWGIMRNIANVAFAIVFLIIIYSQITGAGVSNYGIKKMLPRLIIAVLLVNLSLYICQIAVDLSNILGVGLKSMFDALGGPATGGSNISDGSWGVGGIIVIILALGASVIALALAIGIPVILAVVGAVLMTVLILLLRKALIIILLVVSPLAFVAYLLPNTEQWFKKWGKMFMGLLLVYPVIGVLYGASALAAHIINNGASKTDWMTQLTAIAVAGLPLFLTPSLLKGSLNATGALGAKLNGWAGKANGQIGGKVKESKLGQFNDYRRQQQRLKHAQISSGVKPYEGRRLKGGRLNPLNWERSLADTSAGLNQKFNQSNLSGKFGSDQGLAGERMATKIFADNVTAAKASIKNLDSANLLKIAQGGVAKDANGNTFNGGDIAFRAAAMQHVMKGGSAQEKNALWDSTRTSTDQQVRSSLADAAQSADDRPFYMGAGDVAKMRTGTANSSGQMVDNAVNAGVSPEAIATAPKDELEVAADRTKTGGPTTASMGAVLDFRINAGKVFDSDSLKIKVGKNSEAIQRIQHGR